MSIRKANNPIQNSKIDWRTALTASGFGIACMAMGGLVFWSVSSGSVGGPSGNALRLSQRIVAVLPSNIKQQLAFGVAVIMFLGGFFLFFLGFYGIYKDMTNKS